MHGTWWNLPFLLTARIWLFLNLVVSIFPLKHLARLRAFIPG